MITVCEKCSFQHILNDDPIHFINANVGFIGNQISKDGGNHFTRILAHSSAGAGIAPGFYSINNSIPSGPGAYSGNLILLNSKEAFLSGSCSPCGEEGMASIAGTADGGKTWADTKQNLPGQNSIISFINKKEGWLSTSKQFMVH